MARIPDEELARVKREVDLVALVRAAGVELNQVGEDWVGLCPFHEEKTPSFHVTQRGPDGWPLYHCFGCNAGGDVYRFVELTQHVSFRHAYEIVRAGTGATVPPPGGKRKATPLTASLPLTPDLSDAALLDAVAAYYHRTLVEEGTEAIAYLSKRGLHSAEMVERFKLGYANRTLGYRLPRKTWPEGQVVRERLRALGILRKTGHEHMRGRLVVPILDEQGHAQGLYGRLVGEPQDDRTPTHLYLKGPHKGVWNVGALAASKEVILAEAPLDALTWWAHGFQGVTTSYGVYGFTSDHVAAFQRYGTERVYIAYDRDQEGDAAAEKLAPRLADLGIEVWRVLFPRTKEQKDANAYALSVGASGASPSEALGQLLRSAQFVVKGRRRTSAAETTSQAEAPAVPSALAPEPTEVSSSPPEAVNEETSAAAPMATPSPTRAAETTSPPPPDTEPSTEGPSASSPPAAPEPSPFAAAGPEGTPPPEDSSTPAFAVHGDEQELTVGDRTYRVRGLWRNLSADQMRVNVRVSGEREAYHVDTFDLLSDRQRVLYIKRAAEELSITPAVVKKDLGKLLMSLELLQAARIEKVLTPAPAGVEIPEAEKAEAFALLKEPRLLDRVVEAFDRIGLVGERTNKLVGYLAAVSRKLSSPLAVLIQSNSAAGKSALMDAILELCPEEDVERYTAMTAQSVYYMADVTLKHRILAIAEVAGAEKAGYPIKCLQSDGRISIATTVKDPDTGEMKTKRHEVEGPVAILLTTTEAEIDEELQNRAVVLTVNEDRVQTRAIHEAQRRAETLAGILAAEERQAVVRLHRNVQRLLRPLRVVNPYAEGLSFLDTKLRTRRDHAKYLTLIRAVALLHQYQRPIRQETRNGRTVPYIEVTPADIEVANALANDAIGRSLDDLAPQTRRLLLLVDEMVTRRCAERKVAREDLRFTRREVREDTEWSDPQVWKHLTRLVELEHVLAHRGDRGHSYLYELVYDGRGKDGGRFLVGLIDPKRLSRSGTTVDLTPSEGRSHPTIYPPFTPDLRGSTAGGNGSGAVPSAP